MVGVWMVAFWGMIHGILAFLHIPLRKWFGKFPSDKTRWLFRGKMLMHFSSKNLREDLPTVKLQPSIARQFVIFWNSPWQINLKEGKLGTCLRQLFLQKLRIQTDDTPPWIKGYFLLKMGILQLAMFVLRSVFSLPKLPVTTRIAWTIRNLILIVTSQPCCFPVAHKHWQHMKSSSPKINTGNTPNLLQSLCQNPRNIGDTVFKVVGLCSSFHFCSQVKMFLSYWGKLSHHV